MTELDHAVDEVSPSEGDSDYYQRLPRTDSVDYVYTEGRRRPVTLGDPQSREERNAYMDVRHHVFLNQTFIIRREDLKLWGQDCERDLAEESASEPKRSYVCLVLGAMKPKGSQDLPVPTLKQDLLHITLAHRCPWPYCLIHDALVALLLELLLR